MEKVSLQNAILIFIKLLALLLTQPSWKCKIISGLCFSLYFNYIVLQQCNKKFIIKTKTLKLFKCWKLLIIHVVISKIVNIMLHTESPIKSFNDDLMRLNIMKKCD